MMTDNVSMNHDSLVSKAVEQMILFYNGSQHDICHFLKVWGYARTIGCREGLDAVTQLSLELGAVVHDIACPLCRQKYGQADGRHQQIEGVPLTRAFFEDFGLPPALLERLCYLVGHHHTYTDVQGMDYQILLEADFLVNANEGGVSVEAIATFSDKVFKTPTGLSLLHEMYLAPRGGEASDVSARPSTC